MWSFCFHLSSSAKIAACHHTWLELFSHTILEFMFRCLIFYFFYFSLFSIAMIKHQPNTTCGAKGLFHLEGYNPFTKKIHSSNWNENCDYEETLFTVFWPCFTQLPSLYRADPARCWNSPQWSGPTHIHHQSRKCARDKAIGQSGKSNFSTEIFSSQVTLVCVNLKNSKQKSL